MDISSKCEVLFFFSLVNALSDVTLLLNPLSSVENSIDLDIVYSSVLKPLNRFSLYIQET